MMIMQHILIATNIYKVQTNDSMMCEYFCIGFINVVLKGTSFLDVSPNKYEKIEQIILKYFQ